MEPEDTYLIQEIIQKMVTKDYSFAPEYDDLIKTVVHKNRDGTMSKSVDLSDVSTRDLLNECYRRRAIEKFDYKIEADSYMLEQHPDMREHVLTDLSRGLWEAMINNKKFSNDALDVKEERIRSYMRNVFRGEIYICKHPTKVRK